MVNAWHLQQKFRRAFDSVIATIRFLAHALAAEHALAHQAAAKAASPRKSRAEVRAMYLPPLDPQFLHSLVLFPPDDTASNLNPGDRTTAGFPQYGHGNVRLSVLFNDPTDPE